MKNLLKPLSLALFVAATLPTQSAHIQASLPSDTLPAIGPSSHFCKAIGGKNDDEGKSLIQTFDGGYAITGFTTSFGAGEDDVYVVKLDANGNLQWTKTIGEKERDRGNSLIQTSDGGYAIAGLTQSFGAGETDVYVVKLDANGNLQWTKTIGGLGYDGGTSLIQTSDGGYAITGVTSSFGAGEGDVYVVKLDANGNLQWTKTIGGPGEEAGFSFIQTSDGGYAIAGSTTSFGVGGADVYVVKLDANGNLQWTKTIGGPGDELGISLIQTSDGGYAIAGATESFGAGRADVYVVKLDANGNLQWTKTIGGPELDLGHSLIQTSDGGYVITGATTSFGVGEADVYFVKLDANGNLQRTKTIGAKNENPIRSSIIQTSDGSYVIAGTTRSFGAGGMDVYVVKLDKNGDACCAVSQTSRVGSGGRLRSPTPSIGSGGNLTSPTPSTSSGGTLTNQCP
jgi:DNA replication initiation complex subunit (GINS family)